MNSVITTADGVSYNYSYEKTLGSKPEKITLFFVSEKSYIDGSGLTDSVTGIFEESNPYDGRTYNVWGQEVGGDYKGIVIRNGRKLILR